MIDKPSRRHVLRLLAGLSLWPLFRWASSPLEVRRGWVMRNTDR
ncbi:MAG: hypothetical protein ABI399_05165 [Bauldia sp.]